MRLDRIESAINLTLGIIAIITGLFVPISAYLGMPSAFGANFYIASVHFPEIATTPIVTASKGNSAPEVRPDEKLRASVSVMRIHLWNETSSARQNILIRSTDRN